MKSGNCITLFRFKGICMRYSVYSNKTITASCQAVNFDRENNVLSQTKLFIVDHIDYCLCF